MGEVAELGYHYWHRLRRNCDPTKKKIMKFLRVLSTNLPRIRHFFFSLLILLGSSVADFCERFLGAEVTERMTTGKNLVLFAIMILGLIFILRRFCFRLNNKYGFRLFFIIILFCISFFCYFIRIYLVSRLGSCCSHAGLSGLLILCASGGEILPYSGPSSSSSWTEDSFEMRVLLEPFSETEMEGTSVNPPSVARDEAGPSHQPSIVKNSSLESSIKNRILRLERDQTPFLLDKEKGEYWNNIQTALDQAPSQKEYNRLLEFENRDLQIRELKHECCSLFQQVLSENPALAEKAAYNPQEALIDFFDERRAELETNPEWKVAEQDKRELPFLEEVCRDIREGGPNSIYMKIILGYADNE